MARSSLPLSGLDRIEWARLEHAYGPAVDLPGLFRDFAAGGEAVRRTIVHDWFGRIVHQGSRYSASPVAMPFLVDLAMAGGPLRGELLRLLVELLVGFPDEHLVGGLPSDARESALGRELQAAFDEAIPRVRKLLCDPEAEVREDTAFALIWSRRGKRTSQDAIRRQLADERVPRVRASLLLALGWLGAGRTERKELERALAPEAPIVERVAAAIALARSDKTPSDAVLAALGDVEKAQAALAGRSSPWNAGDWVDLAQTIAPHGASIAQERPAAAQPKPAPPPMPAVRPAIKPAIRWPRPARPRHERILEQVASSHAPLGDRLLVVGDLTGVGSETGCVIAYDATTGDFAPVEKVAGRATALIGDRSGDVWASIDDDGAKSIVRWSASGDRHPAYSVPLEGYVEALGRIGTVLVIGGSIQSIAGRSQRFLAALDGETGALTDFAPDLDDRVSAIAVDGDELWVGGSFGQVNGVACRGVARFEWTGTALRHCPEPALPFADAHAEVPSSRSPFLVSAIAIDDRYLVLAGSYRAKGRAHCHIELYRRANYVRLASGSALEGMNCKGAALDADRVWVCGDFRVAGGGGLVTALGLPALEPLPPAIALSTTVVWNAIPDPAGLWLAGSFDIDGVTRRVARLNPETGAITPLAVEPNGPVFRAVRAGSRIWVAGGFGGALTTRARSAIAVDPATLDAEPVAVLQTAGRDFIRSAAALPDGRIALAGTFTRLGGATRHHLAVFDPKTGALAPFAPKLGDSALGVHGAANRLFVFGEFAMIGDRVQPFVAAFDAHSLELLAWSPSPDRVVRHLVAVGDRVVLGGEFRKIGAVAAPRLAAVSLSTGELLSFPGASDHVSAFAIHGETLFVGGDFSKLGGQPRSCLGAIDLASGAVTPFAPVLDSGKGVVPSVYRLAVAGGQLLVRGNFSYIDGTPRRQVAAFDPKDGRLLDFVPTDSELRTALDVPGGVLLFGSRIARYERSAIS